MTINWKILGHQRQLKIISQEIQNQQLTHAYLFTGVKNIGKTTIARQLAKILQCPNHSCNNCPTCIQINAGQHFDTIELLDDAHKIKIDQIRELIKRAHLSRQSNYNIIIIENIERMGVEAANCLLKSLEEPPNKTLFLLTSSYSNSLLDTVISRTRKINFNPTSPRQLIPLLQEKFPAQDQQTISEATELAFGRQGKAISLIENPAQLTEYRQLNQQIDTILNSNSLQQKFKIIEEISKEKTAIIKLLEQLAFRLHKQPPSRLQANSNRLLHASQKTPSLVHQNVNPRLLLENLILEL